MTVSQVYGYMPARTNRDGLSVEQYKQLASQPSAQRKFGFGQDADLTSPLTAATISTPAQFLQSWLPGTVYTITQARKADEILGTQTVGSWEDEEVIQVFLEQTGQAVPYQDNTQVQYSGWNPNFERRTIVRFELGYQVNRLEAARAAKMNQSSDQNKQGACANSLEIMRNLVSFYGFADGENRTFGLLNDPGLIGYINSPAGAGGDTEFSTKTVNERIESLLLLFQALIDQSGTIVDPMTQETTLSVPSSIITTFGDINEFGVSVNSWLKENYPKMRVETVPQFNEANGGAAVMYLIADKVVDSGTDGGLVASQLIPTKMFSLGTEQRTKGYVQDYSNATAGVLVTRPYAVARMSGV